MKEIGRVPFANSVYLEKYTVSDVHSAKTKPQVSNILGQPGCEYIGRFMRKSWAAVLTCMLGMLVSSTSAVAATDMSAPQVLANECETTPGNFVLSEFWNSKMEVLEALCDYPSIAESDINGQRKPKAYADGSSGVPHDAYAITLFNGTGAASSALGTAPDSAATFGTFCTDPSTILNGELGDVAFSLRAWTEDCRLKSDLLPTVLIFGKNNTSEDVGDVRVPHGIQISSGANYGQAIDYFTPGGSNILIGTGNVSYALPEFAGIVVALNTALISEGYAALSIDALKEVLDASSDEVYLEVNGFRNIYPESQVDSLLQNPTTKYFGQIVNLSNAIDYALGSSPPPDAPDAPSSITASDGTSFDHVATSWASSSGATSYQLFRCTSSNTSTCGSALYTGSGTSYNDTGAVPGVTYTYRAKACSDQSCSAHSIGDEGYRDGDVPAPQAPSSISASDGTSSSHVATSWASSFSATSYQLYRCTSSNTSTCGSALYTGSAIAFNDSGAVPGVTYTYRAKACNSAGCSAFSNGNPGYRAVSPPSAPSSITASDGTSTSYVATGWSSSFDATHYELYRCTGSTTSTCGSALYTGSGTSYNDSSAVPGVTYTYRAKACNSAGCSVHSNGNTGYRAFPPPDAPSSITAADGTSPYFVATSWASSSGATSYQLYRCTGSNTSTCGSARYTGPGTSYNDAGAAPGVTYTYRAKACNSAGCSVHSIGNTGSRAVPPPPPEPSEPSDNVAALLIPVYTLLLFNE